MVLLGPSGALSSACEEEDGRLEAASSCWGSEEPPVPMGAGPSRLPSVGVWTHLHGCAFSSEVGAVETLERTERSRTRPQGLPWDSIRALRPLTLESSSKRWGGSPHPHRGSLHSTCHLARALGVTLCVPQAALQATGLQGLEPEEGHTCPRTHNLYPAHPQ